MPVSSIYVDDFGAKKGDLTYFWNVYLKIATL